MNPLDLPDRMAPLLDADDLDLARVTAVARRDGRRLRRRRHAVAGVAVATAVALAVGAGVSWTGHHDAATFADRSPAPFDPLDPGPATTPTGAGLAAALRWSVAQVNDDTTLDSEGGTGLLVNRAGPRPDTRGDFAALHVDPHDGLGLATISLNVQLAAGPILSCRDLDTPFTAKRLRDALITKSGCVTRTRSDGSVLTTYDVTTVEDAERGHPDGTDVRRVVDLLRPDGVRVVVEADNSDHATDGGLGQTTLGEDGVLTLPILSPSWTAPRPDPVLDDDQLLAIAEQPFWGATLPEHFADEGASLSDFHQLSG